MDNVLDATQHLARFGFPAGAKFEKLDGRVVVFTRDGVPQQVGTDLDALFVRVVNDKLARDQLARDRAHLGNFASAGGQGAANPFAGFSAIGGLAGQGSSHGDLEELADALEDDADVETDDASEAGADKDDEQDGAGAADAPGETTKDPS